MNHIQDLGEAKYIIDKLYNLTVNQIYETSQKDIQLKDTQSKLQEVCNTETKNRLCIFTFILNKV